MPVVEESRLTGFLGLSTWHSSRSAHEARTSVEELPLSHWSVACLWVILVINVGGPTILWAVLPWSR